MNYELFEKAAAVNGQFEVIPPKISILAKGIVIDNNGYMQYKGETYVTNMVKLSDLPFELQNLFIEKKVPVQKDNQETIEEREVKEKKKDNFEKLNNMLFEQLENIVDPNEETDINFEFKKANAICNIADKIISIADLSLKAEIFQHKKTNPPRKSLYSE